MKKTVQLHGGPWHGQRIDVPDHADHFHVQQPVFTGLDMLPMDEPTQVPVKEGTYSRVLGHPNDFEWDGWVTHE